MNIKPTYRLPGLVVAGLLINHQAAAVPSVITSPFPVPPIQSLDQQALPSEMDVFQPTGMAAESTLPEIFRFGPFQLRPQLDYRFTYGNGIQAAPGVAEQTVIQQLSPGIFLNIGSHWAINYTPTFNFYSSDRFKDTLDHSLALTGGFDYEAWQFGLSHNTSISSAPLAETGAQTDQSTHATTLSASRLINSILSADFALNQTITLVSGLQDSYDWSTLDWLNYQFSPRLNTGVGLGAGYILSQGNPFAAVSSGGGDQEQTYEQIQARVNWRATDKISFQISGGLEDRQFSSGNAGNSLNPIFSGAIQYQPFSHTQISLNASHTTSPSDYFLAAQQMESTIVGLTLNQQLFRNYTLEVAATYTRTAYSTASAPITENFANRTDDLVSLSARLSHPFFRRGTWSVFYSYTDDTSSQQRFTFQSNQVGFEISYRY